MPDYLVRADLARADLCRNYRRDLPDEAVAEMSDTLDALLIGGRPEVPHRPGHRLSGAHGGSRSLVATLSAPDGAPIMTIAVCTRPRASARLWAMLHDNQEGLLTRADDPPAAPWLAERIEGPAMLHMDAMRWTGSLARALAWAWMEYAR